MISIAVITLRASVTQQERQPRQQPFGSNILAEHAHILSMLNAAEQ